MSQPGPAPPPRAARLARIGLAVLAPAVAAAAAAILLRGGGGLDDARDRLLELKPRPPAQPVMLGWHERFNDVDGLRANEKRLGTRFAIVRYYTPWRLPSRQMEDFLAEGRLLVSSHKAPEAGWARVASGAEDQMISALADRYRSYGREIVFVFHHEPHDEASDVKGGTFGTSGDFKAAWRRIHQIFVSRGAHVSAGGNVLFGYSAIDFYALKTTPGGPPGSGDVMYPGDDVIDVLAHDAYNWAECKGREWQSFADNWKPLLAIAAAHDKPLIAAEFGSAPGTRNQWFADAARFMRTDPVARERLMGVVYFHAHMDGCHWDFMNQPGDGRPGWVQAFGRDSGFTGTPFSLAAR